jgi:hypothetical protein
VRNNVWSSAMRTRTGVVSVAVVILFHPLFQR